MSAILLKAAEYEIQILVLIVCKKAKTFPQSREIFSQSRKYSALQLIMNLRKTNYN
jgi:hypothetical protein